MTDATTDTGAPPAPPPESPGEGAGALDHAILWINRAFLLVAAVAVVLMMLHVTVDVAWRALANGALIGTVEIVAYYYMVVLVMLAFGYVELRREHIRVDLFVERMPKRVQLWFYLAACAAAAAYFWVLFYQSFLDAWGSTERQETVMANYVFYIWPARWALPLGWAGILLATVGNALKALRAGRAL